MSNLCNSVIYLGVTNQLQRRVLEHKNGVGSRFTRRYNCDKLVYYEEFTDVRDAIAREKQLKNWKRVWKDELIDQFNPQRLDLSDGCL